MQEHTTSIDARLALEAIDGGAWLGQVRAELKARGEGHGALVCFEGVVRPRTKAAERLDALILDHHPRLTAPSLTEIASEGARRFDVRTLSVIHRAGVMSPGDVIVMVAVASDHRREAFECADYLMDRLKTDAVFWKRERGAFGERWIEPTNRDVSDRERWDEKKCRELMKTCPSTL